MSERPVLAAVHLVDYFATENKYTPLQEELETLEPENYRHALLVDTAGETGNPLPSQDFYNETITDIEKGEIEPRDAERLVNTTDQIVLIGGKPGICMANLYRSLVEAGRLNEQQPEFKIDTGKTFTGPGEVNLETRINQSVKEEDKGFNEVLEKLVSNYNLKFTSLEGNEAVKKVENYLHELQQMYRVTRTLEREYETEFFTESDRLTDDEATFTMDGGPYLPSGRIEPRKGTLKAWNIFEDTKLEHDYRLRVRDSDRNADIYPEGNGFRIDEASELFEDELEQLLEKQKD